MQYYEQLPALSTSDILKSNRKPLAALKQEYGEAIPMAFIVKLLQDIDKYFSVSNTIGSPAQVARLIYDEYYWMKPEHFKACFDKAKRGEYGTTYNRVDGQIICEWLANYTIEYTLEVEEIRKNEKALKELEVKESHVLEFMPADLKDEFDKMHPITISEYSPKQMNDREKEIHDHYREFDKLNRAFPAEKTGQARAVTLFMEDESKLILLCTEYIELKMGAIAYYELTIETGKQERKIKILASYEDWEKYRSRIERELFGKLEPKKYEIKSFKKLTEKIGL